MNSIYSLGIPNFQVKASEITGQSLDALILADFSERRHIENSFLGTESDRTLQYCRVTN